MKRITNATHSKVNSGEAAALQIVRHVGDPEWHDRKLEGYGAGSHGLRAMSNNHINTNSHNPQNQTPDRRQRQAKKPTAKNPDERTDEGATRSFLMDSGLLRNVPSVAPCNGSPFSRAMTSPQNKEKGPYCPFLRAGAQEVTVRSPLLSSQKKRHVLLSWSG